jgi:hypothetical protein
MSSPLFDAMGGGMPQNPMMQRIQEFRRFKESFRGDARQEVQNMLNSGRITQEQYNRVVQQAQQMSAMLRNI